MSTAMYRFFNQGGRRHVPVCVTLIPDFAYIPTVPGATGGQTAILILMHVAAAGVIVRTLTALARPQAR